MGVEWGVAKFYPVIHVMSPRQAVENLAVALDAGADGVFLIGHSLDHRDLCRIFLRCRDSHPDAWIGINFLDLPPHLAMTHVVETKARVDALWTDFSGVDDLHVHPLATRTWEIKTESGWMGQYFGGVAFKGQAHVHNLAQAALLASSFMDVITTSGPGTGVPPEPLKVETMKKAATCRLALASGVSLQNVHDYLLVVDAFLVASSISMDFHHLDPERTHDLAQAIHKMPMEKVQV